MPTKTEIFNQKQLKKNIPDIKPGDTVRTYQKKEGKGKEKSQIFEGLVIAIKHGKGISGTITVRKVISGIGVERIFPLHSPLIEKMEIIRRSKVRRAKLYYLRKVRGKKARLKRKEFVEAIAEEEPKTIEEKPTEEKEELKETQPRMSEKEEKTRTEEKKAESKQEEKSSQEDKKEEK